MFCIVHELARWKRLASFAFVPQDQGQMTKMDRAIIDQCVKETKAMLEEDWDQITSMREDNEGRIKVSAAYLISFKGSEQALKTTLTFGRRVSESRESIINPDQLEMPFNGEQEPEAVQSGDRTKKRARTGG